MSRRRLEVTSLVLILGCASAGSRTPEAPATDGPASSPDQGASTGADTRLGGDTGSSADTRRDVATSSDVSPRSDAPIAGSAGCGKAAAAGVSIGMIKVGTLDRTYVLSIPTGYLSGKALPLAFAWHGRTGSGAGFRAGGRSYGGGIEAASRGGAIFVYPDGLTVTPSMPGDTGWHDTNPNGRDFAFFDALLAKLSGDLCVDSNRIFSYGHSFGAFMSQALACHRANVIRAIGAVAGGPPYAAASCPGTPVAAWVDNAMNDGTVDFTTRGIPARDYWIKTNKCDRTKTTPVDPAPCVAYEGCLAGAPLHWCAPATGDHEFPRFSYDGIWNFFAAL